MKPFSEVWAFTDTIPGSFTRLSAEKLYEIACVVLDGGNIVEIGVDQGRSASLLLASSEGTRISVWLVDSWESVLIENYAKVKQLRARFDVECPIFHGTSQEIAEIVDEEFDLIHIDANHYTPHPTEDCEAWLPKLRSGGVACFHDYHESWPAVVAAVDKYTAGWEDLGTFDSLAIRRKP